MARCSPSSPPERASRPTAPRAGPASCGPRHCRPVPTSSPRRSLPTSWRCPPSSWSTWPAPRSGSALVTQWLEMTGLLLVGLAPFVVMGLILGHLVAADALAPAFGGLVVFFALFGGAWGQFFSSGAMLTAVKLLPSYWPVQAGKAALLERGLAGGGMDRGRPAGRPRSSRLAVFAYRHDTDAGVSSSTPVRWGTWAPTWLWPRRPKPSGVRPSATGPGGGGRPSWSSSPSSI